MSKHKKSLYLLSLGCSKNLVDSEVMIGALAKDYEIKGELEDADLIIINTCGFINSAKQESIQNILNASEGRKEDSILVVSGCLSERYQEQLQEEFKNEVDIFTGVGDYDKIAYMIENKKSMFSKTTFLQTAQELNSSDNQRIISNSSYHAYIKISEGCNQSCSFCAIPSFKGKLKSKSIETIVNEVKSLCAKGYFDFSFLAQDSSSYLKDSAKGTKDGLIELIDAIEKIPEVKSARILYLYPSSTSAKLIDAIYNSSKFHNYFDMPLQHSSDKVLKSMKREIINKRVQSLIDMFKKDENSLFRSTFIVGFPGESKEDFKALCKWVKKSKLDRANVFSYSDEEGTSAYELKDKIKQKTIDKRALKLGKIISKLHKKSLKAQIGKTIPIVLIKKSTQSDMLLSAKALMWGEDIDGEILINDISENIKPEFGKIYNAYISDRAGYNLIAKIIS